MTIILGIDPGSRITGYGLVNQQGRQLSYIDSGCIRTGDGELSQRLLVIFNAICQLLETHQPVQVAIEQVFMHQNASAALKLGHARGVAMVAAASHRLAVSEYSPREIKQALVGHGGADKTQVNHMVRHILNLNIVPQADAGDALAAAICHCHHISSPPAISQYSRRRRRAKR
ncbi:crossover junction endodeoxyribonuclease RuvC [Legionella sp. W05-934-2]|jgi:crossover junction endodeoxyribonuclease RuvC|uniref:crossover junction endodeoxyribonuclease RuvC n=1 Tax=Legionella sp. W05-934-2 TaxID=1198649 RepID=UPI003461DFA6